MKRANKLVTFVTIATLALGSTVSVFGANSEDTSTTGTPSGETPVTSSANGGNLVASTTTTVSADNTAVYADLLVTETHYYNDANLDIGVYPVLSPYKSDTQESYDMQASSEELNKKIYDNIWSNYTKFSVDNPSATQANSFNVTYDVLNEGQYAVITVTLNYNKKTTDIASVSDPYVYYVDKSNYTEITEEAYEMAVADATAATETAAAAVEAEAPILSEAAEVPMYALRANSELLGYSLEWVADEKAVVIIIGDAPFTKIYVGVNKYLVNGVETELESAPIIDEGTTYVPVSFFSKVLGANVQVDKDGNYLFAPGK